MRRTSGSTSGARAQPDRRSRSSTIPAPRHRASSLALSRAVGGERTSSDDALDRVVHTYGKSLRDLVRQRRGDLGRLPDVVVCPADEAAVRESCDAAVEADAVVIPFGGGTNISGSLEPPRERDAHR